MSEGLNLTLDQMRLFCAGVLINGSSISYDPNQRNLSRVFDVQRNEESVDCRMIVPSEDLEDSSVPWPLHTQLAMSLIFISLSVIGVVGNILVITVVLRVRGMITPTNCYLVSLAISDAMFFIASAPVEVAYLWTPNYLFGEMMCAACSYMPYLAINLSSLSITAFTIERFIGICYPYQARYICTVKRAKLIICVIWLFSLAYNSPWVYLARLVNDDDGTVVCNFSLRRDSWAYKVIYLGDLVAFYIIPMLLNIVIYVKIGIVLSNPGDKMKHSISIHGGKTSTTTIVANSKAASGRSDFSAEPMLSNQPSEFHINGGNSTRHGSTKGRHQVVKMLAVVVAVFATCWLPYRVMVMYNSFASDRLDSDWYIFFSKTLIFINCAINPILYNLMSVRFRNAFRALLSGNRAQNAAGDTRGGFSPTKFSCGPRARGASTGTVPTSISGISSHTRRTVSLATCPLESNTVTRQPPQIPNEKTALVHLESA